MVSAGIKFAIELSWLFISCKRWIFIWLKVPISIISFSAELAKVEVNIDIDIKLLKSLFKSFFNVKVNL